MPKKTTILIAVLLIFTAGLVYIAIKTEQQQPYGINEEFLTEEELLDFIPEINPQTQISFLPETLDTTTATQSSHTVNVHVNTNGQTISGVQLELSYDPAIITNVNIEASSNNLFGENPAVLINSVDNELGRVSFAIALPGVDDEEVEGNGSIAQLTFSTISGIAQSTQISVLPKTTVRSIKSTNSLLQDASPLNIVFSTPSADIVNPTPPPQEPTPTLQ